MPTNPTDREAYVQLIVSQSRGRRDGPEFAQAHITVYGGTWNLNDYWTAIEAMHRLNLLADWRNVDQVVDVPAGALRSAVADVERERADCELVDAVRRLAQQQTVTRAVAS